MLRRCFRLLITPLFAAMASLAPATAQNQFSPELQVGTSIVTSYQIDQRARFLGLLGAPGDPRALAREQLINEAVQMTAARDNEVEPSPEEVEVGISEFAARANLTAEEFIIALGQAGVSAATFRDFISAGVAWRSTIRARFGEDIRGTISPIQIQRSLARSGTDGGLRVLISEILLPLTSPETALASRERAAQLANLPDEAAFAAAARQFSVATTSSRGGEVNWVALETLPTAIQSTISAMSPGQISRPIEFDNSVGVFLLRDLERVAAGTPDTLSIDYALFTAATPSDAASVASDVDVCDDLYAAAQGLPEDRLVRETQSASTLPSDIRAAVANLDENEATLLNRGATTGVLMLCSRTPELESTVDSDIIANRLLNARLSATAQHYLSQLRASTDVIDLTN